MRFAAPAMLIFATTSVLAQTAATKPKTAVHHTAATKTATKGPVTSADANGPGIPVVTGEPKTLYALRYIDLVVGTGTPAVPGKWLTVHYTGWLKDGTKFDSSVDRGQTFPFPYGAHRVITGWDTGFEGMLVGGKRRLLVPYELAYGERANEKIPSKSPLIFDVELIGVSDTPPAPPAPPAQPKPDAAAPAAGEAPKPSGAPGTPVPATPAPANAPGNPGHPDPAKLPGAPPTGV